jgi:phosphatidylserine decarboxylase
MATPSPSVDKPMEQIHIDSLPDAQPDHLANGLVALVEHSADHENVSEDIQAAMFAVSSIPWLGRLVPGIEHLASKYHIGNFVVVRDTNEKIFESMPIYARSVYTSMIPHSVLTHNFRIGMHLLFYGKAQVKLLKFHTVENLLKEQSIKVIC